MWNDNITLILSAFTLLLTTISCLTTTKQYFKERQSKKKELRKLKIDIKLLENEFKENKNVTVEKFLERLTDIIEELYPRSNITISIRLIRNSNKNNPEDSEVITWITYPNKNYNIKTNYKIKDTTDFYSIVKHSREYFFVSDLKKYCALATYINAERHFLQMYNTSIVVPIQKTNKEKEDIIGFLCITSPQKLGNVQKNKTLVDIVKVTASLFYDYLTKNELNQDTITIKNNKKINNIVSD